MAVVLTFLTRRASVYGLLRLMPLGSLKGFYLAGNEYEETFVI